MSAAGPKKSPDLSRDPERGFHEALSPADLLRIFAEKIEDLEKDLAGETEKVLKGAPAVRVPPLNPATGVAGERPVHNEGAKPGRQQQAHAGTHGRSGAGLSGDESGNAAQAAPEIPPASHSDVFGPRRPCRVCGDLTLFQIHDRCVQQEIDNERAAMDKNDEGPAGGLDLGGSPGCAGGLCEEERDHGND